MKNLLCNITWGITDHPVNPLNNNINIQTDNISPGPLYFENSRTLVLKAFRCSNKNNINPVWVT